MNRGLIAVYALSTCLLALAFYSFVRDAAFIFSFQEDQKKVRIITEHLNRYQETMQNAEIGQRHFLLSKDPAARDVLGVASPKLEKEFISLQRLIPPESFAAQLLNELHATTKLRLIRMEKEIETGQYATMLARAGEVPSGNVEADMSRQIIAKLLQHAQDISDDANEESRIGLEKAKHSLGLFIILTALASLGGYLMIERAWRKNTALTLRLEAEATHDHLTKLPNRRLLMSWMQKHAALSERQQSSFAVLFLDLDGFKAINDQCGHDAGDKALVLSANALRAALRDSDLLARVGGDEFVIVAPDCSDRFSLEELAQRLLTAIAGVDSPEFEGKRLGVSIGIAAFPADGTDLGQVLMQADNAMYRAKQAGKGRVRFSEAFKECESSLFKASIYEQGQRETSSAGQW